MTSQTPPPTVASPTPAPKSGALGYTIFGSHLGAHEFAYLRAIAEGLTPASAAQRYLGLDDDPDIMTVHRQIAARVQALARRERRRPWYVLGVDLRMPAAGARAVPDIDTWAAQHNLEDWSQAELEAFYRDAVGDTGMREEARMRSRASLRRRVVGMLHELQRVAARPAQPTDVLDGWMAPEIAEALAQTGVTTLGDLNARIGRGGRWWEGLPAFGPIKGARLAAHIHALIGFPAARTWLPVLQTSASEPVSLLPAPLPLPSLPTRAGDSAHPARRTQIRARNDAEAVEEWLTAAAANSDATRKLYRREAQRFVLWLAAERSTTLAEAKSDDCRAYMDFLANVPPDWTSRRPARALEAGWAPFKGPLSASSRRVAVAVLASLYEWLCHVGYLDGSPWAPINKRIGRAHRPAERPEDQTHAFTPEEWAMLIHAAARERGPGGDRLRWLCSFGLATGLRASELLTAKLGHLSHSADSGWQILVNGKGDKDRFVPVPSGAMEATNAYLRAREATEQQAGTEPRQPDDVPLLATVKPPYVAVGYRALYETWTRFVRRASAGASKEVRERMCRASTHWLRHTHGTRFAEAGGPIDVLQANLGHVSVTTTAVYYRAQIKRRAAAVEAVFGATTGSIAPAESDSSP